ncbi:MAG: hypothetical protein KGD66_09160 [Candidatus Lokiarchaeota archaeon]|nr:hypothetical protein [Candidatus Lokiarchaeota archaeon]
MPLKIRWSSEEYISIALLLLGGCGLFQVLFIAISQYLLGVGNYLIITIVPLGTVFALYFASLMIYEAFAQVERKDKIKRQYAKSGSDSSKLKAILNNSIARPLLINFAFFTTFFFTTFFISLFFVDNQISFLLAEIISGVLCLLIANYYEKNYAKVRRF